ncbi:InlB B-repeat-containing protein [uncultured Holdemanella sp.]|uniref:InlB B-repeat-containing protein n=2 Tax=Holdemanella TaxID=1573535 RepID=UPI00258D1EED|nr:InlB B-repeat-containing protein [uncultured Holdemanella sp.]
MLKNLKRAAAIVLSFAMAIQFGLANSYYVNAEEEPVEPQQEQTTTVENNSEVQEEDANEVAVPETKSVELSYVAEDGTILQAATYRDFDLNYGLNTDSSVMLNFDGYTLKDVIVNNSQAVSADQASLSVTSDLVSVQFVYKKIVVETENQTTEPCKTEEKNDDDAEADPNPETEVKEELPEYPAFDQSEMAGDVVVHATAAEGVLPRDSKLVVKRITRKAILNAVEETVSEKNMEVESAVALDVTIQSKDGVEIQPNGFVNISFENVATTAQETNVYHVTNDASTVTEVATNAQSFDADHFSIYVITNENKVPLTTFNFVANGTTVSTQIVKSGDTLIAPTAPDMIGQAFVGWVDEAGNSFTGFGKQAEITETTTRTITARYEAALYVYFLNPDGSQIMRTEKVGDHEAHDFTTVSYEVDSTHKLVGWAAEKNGTTNIADKISVPADQTSVNVYAIIKEGYWVSFNSDGGSIVDSQFVLHGDNLVLDKSTTPTKPGYSFDGWYNGLTKVENGATVTTPMNLTAHWKAAQVNYTINYWQQKVTDDKNATDAQKTYEYVEAVTKKATTGTRVSATNSKTYKGFKYNANNSSKDVEISGDGTTIINVYYDRVLCTVNFYAYESTGWFGGGSWNIIKTVTGLYGANLPKGAWDTSTYNWRSSTSSWNSNGCVLLTSFDFESAGYEKNEGNITSNGVVTTCNFYGELSDAQTTINYYNEQADGSYKLVQTIKTGGGTLTVHEKYAGYDLYKYTTEKEPGTSALYWKNQNDVYDGAQITKYPISIASKLKTYSLSYYNYNSVTKTEKNIKYTASLKSYANYTPARPSGLPEYYVFGGWYKDKACTTKFDFNTEKMPNANVQIYAKWTAKKINLTYNLNNPEGTVDKGTTKVAAGTIASNVLPSIPTVDEYSFAGWYVADENGHMTTVAFNANDAILKDTNVIGKWLYNGELKVKYVADGVEAPKDNNVYAGGAKATVANGVSKDGKKFLGWQLDGNVYQPGQNFEVNKDLADDKNVITLTAVFGDSETSAILNYHPGNGNGEDQSVAILNNVEVALESTSNLHYSAPGEDYYFAGWATSMEDAQKGNAKYAVGEKVRVNADSSNDLYATWVKKTVIEVTANSDTLPYNGEVQKVEGFKEVTGGYVVTGLTAVAEGKDFGTYNTEITGTAKVTKGGVDVTDKVIVNKINGTLTISKREVTLTSQTDSKDYDGTPLTRPEVTITGGFVKDEVKEVKATGSVTNVSEGEVTNTITYKTSDNFNSENYSITKNEGKLSITPVTDEVTVTIKGNSKATPYNGTVQSVGGYTVESISNTLYTSTDFTLNGQAMATGKDAAKYPMNLDATQFVNNNTNFSNVKFEIAEDGQLVINPRAVTLTSQTDSKDYDGTPLTRPNVKVEGNFVNGEVTKVEATGSVTYVSEGDVTNTIVITKGENFKESNYSITKHEGTLSITEVDAEVTVTIKGHEDSVTYDGNPHSVEGYEITDISNKLYTKDDVQFTGQAKAEGTEAGTYKMNLAEAQFSNTNSNFKKVTFVVEDGSLTINPKSITPDGPNTPDEKKTGITVTAPEGSKYDGEEHKNKPTVTDTKTNRTLVEGTDYTLSYSEDVINAGTVTVTVKGIGNYEGSFEVTYEITKRNVTLTSGSASKVYDKTALTNDTVTVSGDGFAKDEGATYKVTGSRTKVGTSKNTFTYELKSNTTATNYNIEVKFGDLIVTAEDGEVVVTITGHSDSVEYDGNEKSVSGYEVTITEGSKYTTDDFTFNGTAEAKGTEAGTYPMNLAADQFTNTNDNYKNVRFVVNDGSLTISPKSITPDGPDTPKEEKTGITVTDPINSTYDGNEHINGLTVTDSKLNTTLVEGTDYTLTYSGDLINVGTVTITIKGIGNYTGEFTKTYQILPREYTVTTNTDSKVYDGNPLTAGGTVNNLVDDETVNLTMTGSQTDVGTSDNTYELDWTGSAKESNYKHGKDSIGTLTVTAKSINPDDEKTGITVTDPKDSKYDGEEHKNKPKVEDTKTKATLKEGTDYELSYSEDVTNAGTVTVTVTGIGNYEGSFEVTYEITKRHVTLTSADDEKVYDGSALTNDTVTVGGDKFAKKEGATYNVTGMQIEKGSSKNTFTYTLNEGTLAGNYDIETFEGTLTVTPFTDKVTVTIKGHEDTATYDGNPHSVEGYEVTNISNELYKKDYVGFTGEAKAEGTKAGTYKMNLTAQQFSNTSASFDKVTFKVEDGALTISPKSITPDGPDTPDEKKTGITVTAPEDSKYDGEEHRNKPTVTDTKTKATLKEGTDYELSYSKDVINAGTVTVTVTGIGNYEGSFEVTYEITKRNVTLTSGSASKVYDKTALTNDTVTVSGEGFAKDEGATYKVTGSRTKVGTSKNTFTYELKSNTKASNYNIEVKFGELKVTAQDGEVVVTITGHSDSVDYDGNEKSVSGYDVAITEGSKYTTDDFTFNGNAEAKGTEAGTYPMNLAADQFTNTNDNYTQVTFIVNDGTLTINPKSITPDGPDTPKEEKTGITVTDPENSIYDGNEHINGLTVTDSKLNTTLVENTDYSLTYSGDLINVGTVTITIKGIGNYTGEFTKTYQILPREYTVTTNTDSKVYDGTALTAGGTVNNLVDGETVGFTMTGSQTNVGTSNNTYELNWTGSAKESNYKHGKDSIGTLTVTKQSIAPDPEHPETYKEVTITSPSDEVYDGKEHKWIPTVTDKEENELVAKTDYEVTYSTTDFTNVTGTITVTITGIGNYTGKATRTYSITPKTYTVTTESDSKVYDGTALTAGGKVSGIVKGETVDFTITGSQTSVGTSDNTYELDWTGSAKESNYKHGKDSIGTLTVKAKSIVPDGPDTPDEKKTGITVSDPSDSKYDGKEHREVLTVQDTKKNDELVAEKDYSVTYSDDLVNAGTVTITIEGIGNYTGSFTKTYEITKRSVTLTSATASKTYDGQALTSTSITVSGDGFVKGEGATYNVTGTQTEVGNSANSFEYKLNENTLASNYDITKVIGTLTITAAPAPVIPAPTPRTPSVPQVITPVETVETVEKEETPKAEEPKTEKVEEEYTPKASPQYYWALINLICAILTVLFGLLLLISKRHKDEDDEEEDDETKQQATTNEDEEQEQEKKRGLFTRVLAVLIAIVSVVFFLVTEDMSLAWTWTDQWTIWMVVIGLVQIVVFFVGRKWKNVDNDDDDEEAQQA